MAIESPSIVIRRLTQVGMLVNLRANLADRLRNAMKAAVCLLDIELSQMSSEIRAAYRAKPDVLGIFPVAAYNGGGRNVARLYRALNRMGIQLAELRRAGKLPPGSAVVCPLRLARGGLFGAGGQHSTLLQRK